MFKSSCALLALTVGLCSASQAKASTLDTFQLTGNGDTFTFSLLSPSVPSTGFSCPIQSSSDFCYNGVSVIDNGHNQTDTIEFSTSGDLDIFDNHGHSLVDLALNNHQPRYLTDTQGSVAFVGGTYYLTADDRENNQEDCDECNRNSNYTLVIDPPATTPVPEPSSLALMSSGLLAAAGAVRRRMKK